MGGGLYHFNTSFLIFCIQMGVLLRKMDFLANDCHHFSAEQTVMDLDDVCSLTLKVVGFQTDFANLN